MSKLKGFITQWGYDFISSTHNGLTFNLSECELKKSDKGDLYARHKKSKIQFSLGALVGLPGISWELDQEIELDNLPNMEVVVIKGKLAASQGAVSA